MNKLHILVFSLVGFGGLIIALNGVEQWNENTPTQNIAQTIVFIFILAVTSAIIIKISTWIKKRLIKQTKEY